MNLLQRRRELLKMGGVDPYADWVSGHITSERDVVTIDPSSDVLVSPVLSYTHANTRVRTSFTDGTCRIYAYNNRTGSSAATTRWNGQKIRNITHFSGYDNLRIEVTASEIDDCFVYDPTDAKYIWAGRNVDTPAPPID